MRRPVQFVSFVSTSRDELIDLTEIRSYKFSNINSTIDDGLLNKIKEDSESE